MNHAIQVIPTHQGVGLTTAIIGLFYAFHRQGVKVTYLKPIASKQNPEQRRGEALSLLQNIEGNLPKSPLQTEEVDELLAAGQQDVLLEKILIAYEKLKNNYQLVIIGGLLESNQQPYANVLNSMIAKAIGADVVLATDAIDVDVHDFEQRLSFAADTYGGVNSDRVLGALVNQVGDSNSLSSQAIHRAKIFSPHFQLLAAVAYDATLSYPRTLDAMRFLDGYAIHAGEMASRRIADYALIARTIPNAIEFLQAGYLVITPSDRDDVIMATALAAAAGHSIAGLVLTGVSEVPQAILELCMPLIESSGLPVVRVPIGSWEIAKRMDSFNLHAPADDELRVQRIMNHFADCVDGKWCARYVDSQAAIRLSPAAFKYAIVKQAQVSQQTIVLPEGDEPRTVVAANTCVTREIANCLLLASPQKVKTVANNQGITLHPNLKIVDPETIRDNYLERLIELRSHKGMNATLAKAQLEDNVMLGTMMLEAGEVDGLVSGAVHTTANTIRPPLQIIKTAANCKLVSSIFFMCLPDQVLVYGDCAINPNPNAEQLAEIAIQSADSAKAFGIAAKVAMISYSTGSSGSGADVEKVVQATALVKAKRPDIIIDGPLQYDAAAIASVAAKKAPDSPVAGRANVFIFPDLNTGNTTYKAVQRSANAVSIGPTLQGMRKPVNDLSRGALIDDIIYTIAITAVQANFGQA